MFFPQLFLNIQKDLPWQLEVDCDIHYNAMDEVLGQNIASDVDLIHDNLKQNLI